MAGNSLHTLSRNSAGAEVLHWATPLLTTRRQGNSVTERRHRTLKTVLASLGQGHPLRWPKLLQTCQAIVSEAVHSTTGQQPCFAFYDRHPARAIGTRLPGIDGTEDGVAEAHAILKETHLKMARRYRSVANRRRRNQKVDVGSLVHLFSLQYFFLLPPCNLD